jgi:hypothetical protein
MFPMIARCYEPSIMIIFFMIDHSEADVMK